MPIIQPGTSVLVVPTATSETHEGTLIDPDGRGLTLDVPGGHVFLPWATTEAVWVASDLSSDKRADISKRMRLREIRSRNAGAGTDYGRIEDAVRRAVEGLRGEDLNR
jgi:hypothetical protein